MAPRGKAKKGNVDGATATATEEGVISITMTKDKECKNSIRYVALEPDVPITNVYVMRSLGEMPESFSLQMILD